MKHLLDQLDKALDHRLRLGAATLLMVDETLDFNALKTLLDATDGNLATQLGTLEKAGYLTVSKRFKGKRPQTEYSLTPEGRLAVERHLKALEAITKYTPKIR